MEVYILMITSNMQKSEDLHSSVIFHPDAMQREEEDTGLLKQQSHSSGVLQWDIQLHRGNVRVTAYHVKWRGSTLEGQDKEGTSSPVSASQTHTYKGGGQNHKE